MPPNKACYNKKAAQVTQGETTMYELKDNEKATPIIAYTEDTVIHGKIVTRDIVPVPILLRMEGAPNYIHLLNAEIIRPDNPTKALKFTELLAPSEELIAYHVAPNIPVDLDYEENIPNRHMVDLKVTMGSFVANCQARISTKTELTTFLEVSHSSWLSLYNGYITNTYLEAMKVSTPMFLVRPEKVAFGIIE